MGHVTPLLFDEVIFIFKQVFYGFYNDRKKVFLMHRNMVTTDVKIEPVQFLAEAYSVL